jgi:hypothetical protein
MLSGQKIVVVMPAYNAARTLRRTHNEVMAHGIVDLVIVVDDASHDETVAIARMLPEVQVEVHPEVMERTKRPVTGSRSMREPTSSS